jgi:hypothetical protein
VGAAYAVNYLLDRVTVSVVTKLIATTPEITPFTIE